MLISELTGIHNHPLKKLVDKAEGHEELIKLMNDHGYKESIIGSGGYAIVFDKPGKPWVYKLFQETDIGYLKFYQYAKNNQSNPHLPKILGKPLKVKFSGAKQHLNKNYLLVKIEKLLPAIIHKLNPSFNLIQLILSGLEKYNTNQIKLMKDSNDASDFNLFQNYMYMLEEHSNLLRVLEWIANNRDKDQGIFTDLHHDNIMQRKDGTMVITDPYSSF